MSLATSPREIRQPPWPAVDRLIDAASRPSDLLAHRLHLLAARRWRARGLPVPEQFAVAEREAVRQTLAVPLVLERIRAACDGPLVLMKGYELALRYPDPALRPYDDIDLLTEEPEEVSRALRRAGFLPTGNDESFYEQRHHLRPLFLPDLPLVIEIHRRPEWVTWARPPSTRTLIDGSVPSLSGIDGLSTLAPAHHALAVAAHSWSNLPFRRVLDILDTALLAATAAPGEVEHWARVLGIERLWSLTARVQEALLGGAEAPASLRLWGRATLDVRELTVREVHRRRLLADFAVLPARRAIPHALRRLMREVTPDEGEPWSSKLSRTVIALRHRSTPHSVHERRVAARRRKIGKYEESH